jgi:hypothetical protein
MTTITENALTEFIYHDGAVPSVLAPKVLKCPTMGGKPCMGNACAAWRGVLVAPSKYEGIDTPLPGLGYCGLSPKPEAVVASKSDAFAEAKGAAEGAIARSVLKEFTFDEGATKVEAMATTVINMGDILDSNPHLPASAVFAAFAYYGYSVGHETTDIRELHYLATDDTPAEVEIFKPMWAEVEAVLAAANKVGATTRDVLWKLAPKEAKFHYLVADIVAAAIAKRKSQ